MITALKNSLVSFLMVSIMAPFLYLGIAPAQKVEAGTGSIITGGVVGAMVCMFDGYIEGFMDTFDLGKLGNMGGGDSVPTNETNSRMLSDIANTKESSQDNAESAAELIFKECVLDAIIWVIKRVLIDKITGEIMDWINKGFDSAPVFISDHEAFFRKLAANTFNSFLDTSDLDKWLCSPFQNEVRQMTYNLGSQQTYGATGNASCSLADVFLGTGVTPEVGYANMVDDGDINFDGGGLTAAMGLLADANNPYGSMFNVQAEAAVRTTKEVSQEANLLDYADGFFSIKCDDTTGTGRHVCTPGQLISKQVDDWLGGGLGQLEVADEVAEVLTEVLASLVNSIFTDTSEGLLSGARDTGVVNEAVMTYGTSSAPAVVTPTAAPIIIPTGPPVVGTNSMTVTAPGVAVAADFGNQVVFTIGAPWTNLPGAAALTPFTVTFSSGQSFVVTPNFTDTSYYVAGTQMYLEVGAGSFNVYAPVGVAASFVKIDY